QRLSFMDGLQAETDHRHPRHRTNPAGQHHVGWDGGRLVTLAGDGRTVNQSTDRLAELPKYILRARSSDGLTGIGETYRFVNLDHLRRNAKKLCGRNLFEMRLANLDLPEDREYDGFELLIYDMVGKSLGVPAYQLLGGACRDGVLCSMWT